MSKQQPISLPLDSETVAEIDELAARLDCSREALIEAAIHRFVDEQDSRPPHARLGFETEAELEDYLKPALDDIAAGRTRSQEQVDTVFEDMIARQRARAR